MESKEMNHQSHQTSNIHQYINLSQVNNTAFPVPCSVTASYGVPVADNASLYELAIWRFLLPLSQLPIFIAEPLTYDTPYYTGTAQGGSTTTSVILDSNANAVDDTFYLNSDVKIDGEYRAISSYSSSTKTLTLATALSNNPINKIVDIVNKDYTRLKYSITYEYNTVPCQRYIQYIPNSSVANGIIQQPTDFSITHPVPTQLEVPYYFVYSYEQFIHLINDAILYSYNLLINLVAMAPQSPQYFEYDPVTQLIGLYSVEQYGANSAVDVALNMNVYLQTFFTSYNMYHLDNADPFGMDYQVIVYGTGTNDIKSADFKFPSYYMDSKNAPFVADDGFKTTGEYNSQYYWNSFRSIVFQTTLLPINPEVIPNNSTIVSSSTISQSATQYKSILTDFEISANQSGDERSYAQFFPQGPLRKIDLLNNKPIAKIDIQVYWTDIDGNFYPLYLPVNNAWDIKLGLRRKKLVR